MRSWFIRVAGLVILLLSAACEPRPQPPTPPQATLSVSPNTPTANPASATPPPRAATATPAATRQHLSLLRFVANDQLLVAGEQTVSLLDPVTQHLQWSTVVAAGCCREAAFAGNWLAAIGGDGVYVWEVTTGRQLYRLEDSAGQFATLALSPDGETLATGEFGQIRVWEARTGQERARWDTGDEGLSNWPLTAGITNLIFTPDGQRLYSANGWSGQVMEWEAASGELRTTLVFTNALHFAFTPDASQLLVEYNDYGFELHDPETGTLLARRAQIISAPGWLTFSGDGQRVAAWGYTTAQGNTAGVWELATETRLQEFSNGGSGGAAWTRAALNGDGSLLALSNERATMIYVFEVATGRQINAFPTP